MKAASRSQALWMEVGAVVGLALLPNLLVPWVYGVDQRVFDFRSPLVNLHYGLAGLGLLLPVLFILWASDDPWRKFGFRMPRMDIDGGIAVLIVLLPLFLTALLSQTGVISSQTLGAVFFAPQGLVGIASAVFALVVLAFYEEVVFRGFLIARLEELTGKTWIAVLSSSFLFGSEHLYQGWFGALNALVIGLMLSCGFVLRRNLWPLALGHFGFNLMLTFMTSSRP